MGATKFNNTNQNTFYIIGFQSCLEMYCQIILNFTWCIYFSLIKLLQYYTINNVLAILAVTLKPCVVFQ